MLYEPVLMAPDGDGVGYQAGAFRREEDAQTVVDLWRSEGRREEIAINQVPVYESVDHWQAER